MPFKPGESGNKAGRKPGSKNKTTIPKLDEINNEIQRYGLRAIKKLVKQMDDKTVSANIQQKNAQWIAEQFFKIEDMKSAIKDKPEEASAESREVEKKPAVVVSLKAISDK